MTPTVCIQTALLLALLAAVSAQQQQQQQQQPPPQREQNDSSHVFMFMQVSDLHLSEQKPDRATDFERFVQEVVPLLDPAVVVCSGDITHAQDAAGHAMQSPAEWGAYRDSLQRAGLFQPDKWIDTWGNHDTRNVVTAAERHWMAEYTVAGRFKLGAGSDGESADYAVSVADPADPSMLYQFIAVDAALKPGPRRLFNMWGHVTAASVDAAHAALEQERQERRHAATIMFGHYPLFTTRSEPGTAPPHHTLKQLVAEYAPVAYLSGHAHQYVGRHLYSNEEHLELELGDWKEHRVFRVAAFDAGSFSFVDTTLDAWPLVLVTTPADARFGSQNAAAPAVPSPASSSDMKLLAFSPHGIRDVTVTLQCKSADGRREWSSGPLLFAPAQVQRGLYKHAWPSEALTECSSGVNSLEVVVVDAQGNKELRVQPFTLDGTVMPLGSAWTRFVLSFSFDTYVPWMFWAAWAAMAAFLALPKLGYSSSSSGCKAWPRLLRAGHAASAQLAADRAMWLSFVAFVVYLPLGPWFLAEFGNGVYAVPTLWALFYLDGTTLVILDTWYFAIRRIVMYAGPALVVATLLAGRPTEPSKGHAKQQQKRCLLWLAIAGRQSWLAGAAAACGVAGFCLLTILQLMLREARFLRFLWQQNGPGTVLASPLAVFSLVSGFQICWRMAMLALCVAQKLQLQTKHTHSWPRSKG